MNTAYEHMNCDMMTVELLLSCSVPAVTGVQVHAEVQQRRNFVDTVHWEEGVRGNAGGCAPVWCAS